MKNNEMNYRIDNQHLPKWECIEGRETFYLRAESYTDAVQLAAIYNAHVIREVKDYE